eukprot:234309_1
MSKRITDDDKEETKMTRTRLCVTKEQNSHIEKYGFHCNSVGKIVPLKTTNSSCKHPSSLPLNVLHEFIQNIFQMQYKMERISMTSKLKHDVLSSNIFISPKYNQKKTLLLIITGFGKVNAGEWSTSVCINDNIMDGTGIPFISYAYKRHWGVLLLDTNGIENSEYEKISERSKIYEKIHLGSVHCVDVFDKYIAPFLMCNTDMTLENIVILAHSAGGINVTALLEKRGDMLQHYIKRIAFTDIKDPHQQIKNIKSNNRRQMIKRIYKTCARNWVKTKESVPLNQQIKRKKRKNKILITQFSAGHTEHKYTTTSAFKAIFSFFEE